MTLSLFDTPATSTKARRQAYEEEFFPQRLRPRPEPGQKAYVWDGSGYLLMTVGEMDRATRTVWAACDTTYVRGLPVSDLIPYREGVPAPQYMI